jgi:hypothetical protein
MGRIIRKTFDRCKPTKAEIKRVEILAARPDREIDLSDIPELDWEHPIRNPFCEKLAESRKKPRQS